MLDRAHQTLAKFALEPEWEAKFEPNSYGFRPGRSVHDAIGAIFNTICKQPKYVLDADIAGCFNTIAHTPLLTKLQTFPAMRHAIHGWLKAGVLEEGVFVPTQAGTPQGGCISPLLANIALHGMEQIVKEGYARDHHVPKPKLIRYADDLVVFFPIREGIEHAKVVLQEWLKERGLELHPSKTHICHTLEPLEDLPAGFDFLGFTVRQYPVGKYQSGRHNHQLLGFKTLIKPSSASQSRHHRALRDIVERGRSVTQAQLIGQLNARIRGWTHYFRHVVAKAVFQECDHHLFPLLLRWAKRRHPRKSGTWVVNRYWRTKGNDRWCFATADEGHLLRHASVAIQRHRMIRTTASPYDGNLVYWAQRVHDTPLVTTRLGKLLAEQRGKCRSCGLYFRDEDVIEIDHILPRSLGGSNLLSNLMAIHRHCHDQRHAQWAVGGGHDKDPLS